jgi:vacuolar protein sorting-associated protein 13A/C
MVKINESDYSYPFSLDQVGVSGDLSLVDLESRYSIAFYNGFGSGKFKRTKMVSFTPRYIITNRTAHAIGIKQEGSKYVTVIPAHQQINYYWRQTQVEDPRIFVTMKEGEEMEWSASAFALNVLGESDIKLVHHFARLRGIPITRILKMTIKESMGTIFVSIEFPSKPPYLIDNQLDEDIIVSQVDHDKRWIMEKNAKTAYGWDDYNGNQLLNLRLTTCPNMPHATIDINKVNYHDKLISLDDGRTISVKVIARGPTRIMRVSNYMPSNSSMMLQSPTARSQIQLVIIGDEGLTQDDVNLVEEFNFFCRTNLHGIGLSVIGNNCELCYVYMASPSFHYETTDRHQFIECQVTKLQIDNQTYNATFPVIFTNK